MRSESIFHETTALNNQNRQSMSTKELPDCMGTWAVAGLIFIVNSFVLTIVIDDSGFISSVSALIAVAILIIPVIRTLISDIRSGSVRMHELAVLAILASCIQGDLKTSALIAFFILLSIIIETRTATGARISLESLAKLSPGKARRIGPNKEEEEVDSQELCRDDIIRVRPGESLLADGLIVKGDSSINEANITGESLPVDKTVDDQVFAGTSNLTGALDIKVVKAGEDTTIGKVKELILKAQSSRLPFVRMIDEYIKYYMPLVLMIAATVLFFTRHQADGVSRVVALLVATCPIALILATPAAVVAALASAARLGVLFKDVNDIESMARIDTFVFDKTGTLTTGILEVGRLAPADGVETTELLKAAMIAEAGSNHPVAIAITLLAKEVNLTPVNPDSLHEEPGRGVKVHINDDVIVAGNLAWMQDNGLGREKYTKLEQAESSGMSLLFVAKNEIPLGWIGLTDKPRENAARCLAELSKLGIDHLAMVSGDRNQVVDAIADTLSISDSRGQCTPSDKVAYVNEVRRQGRRVVFVGDGVNDGPALATSHVGIAMGAAGSDVALGSATVALMNNNLDRLPFLLKLAKKMKTTILQNFVVGALIIAGGISLSAMGQLSPVSAAVIQAFGALVVAMNSAKLIRHGEEIDCSQSDIDHNQITI